MHWPEELGFVVESLTVKAKVKTSNASRLHFSSSVENNNQKRSDLPKIFSKENADCTLTNSNFKVLSKDQLYFLKCQVRLPRYEAFETRSLQEEATYHVNYHHSATPTIGRRRLGGGTWVAYPAIERHGSAATERGYPAVERYRGLDSRPLCLSTARSGPLRGSRPLRLSTAGETPSAAADHQKWGSELWPQSASHGNPAEDGEQRRGRHGEAPHPPTPCHSAHTLHLLPCEVRVNRPPLWGAFSPRPSVRVPMDSKGRSLRGEEVEVPPGLLGYMMLRSLLQHLASFYAVFSLHSTPTAQQRNYSRCRHYYVGGSCPSSLMLGYSAPARMSLVPFELLPHRRSFEGVSLEWRMCVGCAAALERIIRGRMDAISFSQVGVYRGDFSSSRLFRTMTLQ
ncbi:hypothetical protein QTO34_007194, partial [Cnephaeus nilssonii]